MNLFYLDENPETAAKMHHDKHVVKMILETAQLLSTAHRVLDGELWHDQSKNGRKIKRWKLNGSLENILYKATHVNHPSNIWVRECKENYIWAYRLFVALCSEYTHRYGKVHLTETKLKEFLNTPPSNIENKPLTKMPQAMPDVYKDEDSVKAYRNYYITEKKGQSKYTNRETPFWLLDK